MQCIFCQHFFNEERTKSFMSGNICVPCGIKLIESLFGNKEFNEWLDSFMQSRLVGYIPGYHEYYDRHNKQPCPDCHATGFIDGNVCGTCNFVGAIDIKE